MKNIVFLLYYTPGEDVTQVQLLCSTYGYAFFRIDEKGALAPGGDKFSSLQEAIDDPRFKGWTWTFFDPDPACEPLSKFQHQNDDSIYVFGEDTRGFERLLDGLAGALVRIEVAPGAPRVLTAALCAEIVIPHRFNQVDV